MLISERCTKKIRIVEEHIRMMPEYAGIPIAFEVRSIFQVDLIDGGLGGIRFTETPVIAPWIKDYDAPDGEGPEAWAEKWDISNWGVISAFCDDKRLGGCVVAYDTPGVGKLKASADNCFLWDIRVAPQYRGSGIGGLLVEEACRWARYRECLSLKVETQNINVPACRFYAGHGFKLSAVNRHAYAEMPDEVELIWCRML